MTGLFVFVGSTLSEMLCGGLLKSVPMTAQKGPHLNGTERLLGNLTDGLLNSVFEGRIFNNFETSVIDNPVLLNLVLCIASHPK